MHPDRYRYLSEQIYQAVHAIYSTESRRWTSNGDVIHGVSTLMDNRANVPKEAEHHARVLLDLLDKHAAAGPQIDHILDDFSDGERSEFRHHLWELEGSLDSAERDWQSSKPVPGPRRVG